MRKVMDQHNRALSLEERLSVAMERKLERSRHRMELYTEKLRGLSPLEKFSQGFSYVSDKNQRAVTDVDTVTPGEEVVIHVTNGELTAQITGIRHLNYDRVLSAQAGEDRI